MHQRSWNKNNNAQVPFFGQLISIFWEEPSPRKVSNPKRKKQLTSWIKKFSEAKSKKALQRYLGFLNYYRKHIPRLSKKLVPFFQLLKKFNETNQDFDRCSKLALKQPLIKYLVLMSDTSFSAAGYAIMTEDDPNQKFISVKKSYAPITYGSKTFTPSQLKMSTYAKEFLAIYYAFKEFEHFFLRTPKR